MANERTTTLKLGLFVLAGTALLVIGLYLIGSKRDLFARTLTVEAHFKEVSGLRTGDNVRYVGIDVGTVKDIWIVSDTEVAVRMVVRLQQAEHIRTNAWARIASDGLMGSKLVELSPGDGEAGPLTDGAVLHAAPGLDTDAMLRTLSRSNDNLVEITGDLRTLAHRLNSNNGLLTLLDDTAMTADLRSTVRNVGVAAENARAVTERVNTVVRDLEAGKGALGAVLHDPATDQQVRSIVGSLEQLADSLTTISGHLGRFAEGLNAPGSLGHTLTRDTALVTDVKRVVANLDTSTTTLNEDLRALQRNWFFRRYFKEKEKAKARKPQ